jgi:hypothetical protein
MKGKNAQVETNARMSNAEAKASETRGDGNKCLFSSLGDPQGIYL